ncbi:hypothetical protein MPH_07496 [Macrophomina phaseolina MS6]|uniref:Retrovirus-related Pol polyprotein from transposon TNT 1-94-like beta-barrel domain-containing protein n=1 Tax=Macrophomina phaseolina (strain MS6) TaxID=1126212 RepID=K2RRC2_MACPH|nr:hypothetical protein MPH_07496 [Macrophomina phaseolina MS6]
MTSSKPIVVLKTPDNWDEWYFIVRSRARKSEIIDYINPSLSEKPAQPTKPIKPPKPTDDESTQAWERYKIRMRSYERKLRQYQKLRKGIDDLSTFIKDSVSQSLLPILYELTDDPHPHLQLLALKAWLQRTKKTQEGLIISRLRQLEKPPSSQNIEKWLAQWEETLFKAEELELPDIAGNRGKAAFLKALTSFDGEWATFYKIKLYDNELTKPLHNLIIDYRNYQRQNASEDPKTTRAVFTGTLRDKKRVMRPPSCLCGERHWFKQCGYCNQATRPANWTPNKEIQDRVNKALEDPQIKEKVERALKRFKETQGQKKQDDASYKEKVPNQSQKDNISSLFPAVVASARNTQHITRPTTLDQSWIADISTTHHICNEHMKTRYTKTRDAGSDDHVTLGNTVIRIESFGEVTIDAINHEGPRTIKLVDVAYVPTFIANLVSITKAREKGIELDTGRKCLYLEDFIVAYLTVKYNYFFVEYKEADGLLEVTSNVANRSLPAT